MTDQTVIEESLTEQILIQTFLLLEANELFNKEIVNSLRKLAKEGRLTSHDAIITILKQNQEKNHENP